MVSFGLRLIISCFFRAEFQTQKKPSPPPPSSESPPCACLSEPAGLVKPGTGAQRLITMCPLDPAACFQVLEACISARDGGRPHAPSGHSEVPGAWLPSFLCCCGSSSSQDSTKFTLLNTSGAPFHFGPYKT